MDTSLKNIYQICNKKWFLTYLSECKKENGRTIPTPTVHEQYCFHGGLTPTIVQTERKWNKNIAGWYWCHSSRPLAQTARVTVNAPTIRLFIRELTHTRTPEPRGICITTAPARRRGARNVNTYTSKGCSALMHKQYWRRSTCRKVLQVIATGGWWLQLFEISWIPKWIRYLLPFQYGVTVNKQGVVGILQLGLWILFLFLLFL